MLEKVNVLVHSCVRIAGENPLQVIYFDPFRLDMEPHDADYIFITHNHSDHYSPQDIRKVMKQDTVLIIPESIENTITDMDIADKRIVKLKPGEFFKFPNLKVEAVAAYNAEKDFHQKEKKLLGYIITIDQIRYYITGDTDCNEDNCNVQCDVVLVPVGGTYTFNPHEAAEFVNLIHPKAAIPTHYNCIVGKKEDGETFVKLVNKDIETVLKL